MSWSIRITVSDDFVPLPLNGQGGDQTRQQQFRPNDLRAGGGKQRKTRARKEKRNLLVLTSQTVAALFKALFHYSKCK
jgi:hypothetical protein